MSADQQALDVNYDYCSPNPNIDGDNEAWYVLKNGSLYKHLSHEETTVRYYFANYSKDGTYTWTTDVSQTVANDIKEAYARSMEKWNNVYFYSYDASGNVIKRKLINVVPGTANNSNLTIYPVKNPTNNYIAWTNAVEDSKDTIKIKTGLHHLHYSEWEMNVNVEYFYEHIDLRNLNDPNDDRTYDADLVAHVRERDGAHELGHVLGLLDLDNNNLCNGFDDDEYPQIKSEQQLLYHHHEVLMGYGAPFTERSADITYKDIAGVAITRGFHTDNDHKWLYAYIDFDGTHKLICSICNGTKNLTSEELNNYTYEIYGDCGSEHGLSSGNMMAVASYGTKDYYKCKYCRYVAPFDNIVQQNYGNEAYYSEDQHIATNMVNGLSYTCYESHSYTHHYQKYSAGSHISYCACGDYVYQPHVVSGTAGELGSPCIYCRQLVDFGVLNSIPADYPHTENGSYILPSGVIVLVPEDEEEYLNGTLEFRTGEIM